MYYVLSVLTFMACLNFCLFWQIWIALRVFCGLMDLYHIDSFEHFDNFVPYWQLVILTIMTVWEVMRLCTFWHFELSGHSFCLDSYVCFDNVWIISQLSVNIKLINSPPVLYVVRPITEASLLKLYRILQNTNWDFIQYEVTIEDDFNRFLDMITAVLLCPFSYLPSSSVNQ